MYISKNIFHQNGYPYRIVDNCVKFFINNKHNPKAKDQNSKSNNNRCIMLPYVGNASLVFIKALITQFKRKKYHCNVNFRSYKVYNYFSLKDMIPLTHKANDVYCLKGSCDKTQFYIGKTFACECSRASFCKIMKMCYS